MGDYLGLSVWVLCNHHTSHKRRRQYDDRSRVGVMCFGDGARDYKPRRTSRCGPAVSYTAGEYTDGGGSVWGRPHLLQSEACYEGSQTKEACVLCVTLNYIISVWAYRKKDQEAVTGQEAPPKRGLIGNYNPFPKQYTFLLARGPLTSLWSWEMPKARRQTLPSEPPEGTSPADTLTLAKWNKHH